jgi:hypothetical protein
MYLTLYTTSVSHAAHPNARRIVNKILWEICVNEVDKTHSHGYAIVAHGNKRMHQVFGFPYMKI